MSQINVTFLPANITTQAHSGDRLIDLAHANGLDIQMACGGNCACSTCRIIVKEGEFLPASDMEQMWGLPSGERLGCQCILSEEGSVTVEIPR